MPDPDAPRDREQERKQLIALLVRTGTPQAEAEKIKFADQPAPPATTRRDLFRSFAENNIDPLSVADRYTDAELIYYFAKDQGDWGTLNRLRKQLTPAQLVHLETIKSRRCWP